MSRSGGRTQVVTLILTGIAVNAFAGALIGLFPFFADAAALTQITFWQLGSLSQATWPKVKEKYGYEDKYGDEGEAAVAWAMAATEVTGFAARPFSALSGGERARVALARVLAQRPPLLLFDEPTTALDLRHQELVLRLCRARAGDAVVVVLHDLGLAVAYAHRVAVLRAGRVAADGPPGEVFTRPRTGAVLVLPARDGSAPA